MWCEVSIVDRLLNKSFGKLGVLIGHHPGYFIIIPVLLTLLCITGYVLRIGWSRLSYFIINRGAAHAEHIWVKVILECAL